MPVGSAHSPSNILFIQTHWQPQPEFCWVEQSWILPWWDVWEPPALWSWRFPSPGRVCPAVPRCNAPLQPWHFWQNKPPLPAGSGLPPAKKQKKKGGRWTKTSWQGSAGVCSLSCGGELRFRTNAEQEGFIFGKVFYPCSDSQGLTLPVHWQKHKGRI